MLVCGLGQPAGSWELGMVPALTEAGFHVVTFDNRGHGTVVIASFSVHDRSDGGRHDRPDRPCRLREGECRRVLDGRLGRGDFGFPVSGPCALLRVFIGSCNAGTSWEKVITTVERDLARIDPELPQWFNAAETMRYLPNHELQQDGIVDDWIALIGDLPPWPNPGRLGQYEAALAWSLDYERTNRWPLIAMPCMVLSFEHDVDSPPAHAREAASKIPGCRIRRDRRCEPSRGVHPREAGRRRGGPLSDRTREVTEEQTARVDQWLWSVRVFRHAVGSNRSLPGRARESERVPGEAGDTGANGRHNRGSSCGSRPDARGPSGDQTSCRGSRRRAMLRRPQPPAVTPRRARAAELRACPGNRAADEAGRRALDQLRGR